MCDKCIGCEQGVEEARRLASEMIEKYGWYSHIISRDDGSPTKFNYHTHNFPEFLGIPDVQVVCNIDQQVIHSIVSGLVGAVKAGRKIELNRRESGILRDYDVMFVEAEEGGRSVWRLILPDPANEVGRSEISPPFSSQYDDLAD